MVKQMLYQNLIQLVLKDMKLEINLKYFLITRLGGIQDIFLSCFYINAVEFNIVGKQMMTQFSYHNIL